MLFELPFALGPDTPTDSPPSERHRSGVVRVAPSYVDVFLEVGEVQVRLASRREMEVSRGT